MRMVGNEVHIQRGETWSLDFAVRNAKGDPFMIFKQWENPYLVITIASTLYEQEDDYREIYWLDLSNRLVEDVDGSIKLRPIKKFISTEALYLSTFDVEEALTNYGSKAGGKMVDTLTSDFYVGNYLFYVDANNDGNRVYKYYDGIDVNGDEVWIDYDFRIVKAFETQAWVEQSYLYDIKILAGQSVREYLAQVLETKEPDDGWSDSQMKDLIDSITDDDIRTEMLEYYESGMPLIRSYDTKALILEPTRIYVGANIQGGVR